MAGLCAAARALELGARPVVLERGARPGGSMVLSSGVVWRHRSFDDFRRECPAGDGRCSGSSGSASTTRSRGSARSARRSWDETGNPLTVGVRFEPRGSSSVAALAGDVGSADARCDGEATVLATGGFAASADLVTRYIRPAAPLRRRGNPWSTGGGLRHALDRGAALTRGMDEFYGRNMPDARGTSATTSRSPSCTRGTRGSSTSTARSSSAPTTCRGRRRTSSRRPRGAGRAGVLPARRGGARAARAGADRARAGRGRAARGARPARPPSVRPAAGNRRRRARHRGDHAHDRRAASRRPARVLDEAGAPIAGLWAAGVDAGGVATGGYASGLAQAPCSASRPPRTRWAENLIAGAAGTMFRSLPDREHAPARVAGKRRGADLVDDEHPLVLFELAPDLRWFAVLPRSE